MQDYVRLPLEGAENVRDLGGYVTKQKEVTKFHVFLRGSCLTQLTEKDNKFLKNYQITDVIDLRGNSKIQENFVSDDQIDTQYFHLHSIPLSTEESEKYVKENLGKEDFDYGKAYILFLKNSKKIREIFKILAKAEGGVLFHCTAGKDRTGVIAALLLGICEVPEKDIIANYEVTNTYMKDTEIAQKYDKRAGFSKAQYMETFLQELKKNYISIKNYLLSCGITEEEMQKIKEKFCEPMEKLD